MAAKYGPSLPPDMLTEALDKEIHTEGTHTTQSLKSTNVYGPSLPPDLLPGDDIPNDVDDSKKNVLSSTMNTGPIVGPSLPPEFSSGRKETEEITYSSDAVGDSGENERFIGPCFPVTKSKSDHIPAKNSDEDHTEESVIGPVLPTPGYQDVSSMDLIKESIESRAKKMQNKLTVKDEDTRPSREVWMTELPPEFRVAGVGARKFRSDNPEIGDRSIWTDTPAEKEKKRQEAQQQKKVPSTAPAPVTLSERDKEMEGIVSEYNTTHRAESLMDMHHRKRKAGSGTEERRPFDRERDLEIKHILPSGKRREMVQQSSRDLSSKFAPSTKEKFL